MNAQADMKLLHDHMASGELMEMSKLPGQHRLAVLRSILKQRGYACVETVVNISIKTEHRSHLHTTISMPLVEAKKDANDQGTLVSCSAETFKSVEAVADDAVAEHVADRKIAHLSPVVKIENVWRVDYVEPLRAPLSSTVENDWVSRAMSLLQACDLEGETPQAPHSSSRPRGL